MRASCDSCGKTFNVPGPGKTYRCKACGGRVRAAARTAGLVACTACAAIVPEGRRYCEECGAPVDDPEPARKTRRSSAAPAADPALRREASQEMRQAQRAVGFLKSAYILAAFVAASRIALVLVALSANRPVEAASVIVGIGLTVFVLFVLGALFVERKPFVLGLVIAGSSTLGLVLSLLDGHIPIGGAVWTFLAWSALVPAARLERLAREHPDLYLARKMRGEHLERRSLDDSLADRHERVHDREAAGSRRFWLLLGGGALGLLGLLAGVNVVLSAPRPIEPRLESFRTAWNASDRLSLDALYHPTMQTERQSQFFGKALRIWDDELPEIGPPTTEPRPKGRTAAAFPLTDRPNDRVLTRWFVSDGEWYLETLTVPAPGK